MTVIAIGLVFRLVGFLRFCRSGLDEHHAVLRRSGSHRRRLTRLSRLGVGFFFQHVLQGSPQYIDNKYRRQRHRSKQQNKSEPQHRLFPFFFSLRQFCRLLSDSFYFLNSQSFTQGRFQSKRHTTQGSCRPSRSCGNYHTPLHGADRAVPPAFSHGRISLLRCL